VERPTDPARLLALTVPGPAGPLEGLLRLPPRPTGAAVVAHPHPLHGGTMHTKVVHRAARLLADAFGLATLRFNFRGVGASAGSYDGGPGETEDLAVAARWIRERYPSPPFVLAGFSFGSICALHAASRLAPDVLFLIGVPIGAVPALPAVPAGTRVFWIHGGEDAYGAVAGARRLAAGRGWDLGVVPGADHFFTGRLPAFEAAALRGLARATERREP
jgi:alpha/beta superfamily hydrolase